MKILNPKNLVALVTSLAFCFAASGCGAKDEAGEPAGVKEGSGYYKGEMKPKAKPDGTGAANSGTGTQ